MVTDFELQPSGLVIDVRPKGRRPKCGVCGHCCRSWKDRRVRTWRHLDFAGTPVDLRYAIRRAECPHCGVQTEAVPWADPGSPFTHDFEDTVALMAQRADKTFVSRLLQIAWRTVGSIVQRVTERRAPQDPLDGLTRIGIDDISYRKGHQYLTVVVDHVAARVVWIGVGRTKEVAASFFTALGPERTAKLREVTIDMAESYASIVTEKAPQATLIFDRFHVQRLVHDAIDEVRRSEARAVAETDTGKPLKKTRWALQKRPWNLTLGQSQRLNDALGSNQTLYRAYIMKESLAGILDELEPDLARKKLLSWCNWTAHSKLPAFARAGKTIRKHLKGIVAYVETRLSSGRVEGINRKIRTITSRAYGFSSVSALKSMIFLCCGGVTIPAVRHYPRLTEGST